MPLFHTITDPQVEADVLRRRRYGLIEVRGGELHSIRLRPYPKLVSLPEVRLAQWRRHRPGPKRNHDAVWLYYNQPRSCSAFLSVTYAASRAGTSLASIQTALRWLDEIARLKGTLAIVADVSNVRISERALARFGWESQGERWLRRPFIKRFYGEFAPPLMPAVPTAW